MQLSVEMTRERKVSGVKSATMTIAFIGVKRQPTSVIQQ